MYYAHATSFFGRAVAPILCMCLGFAQAATAASNNVLKYGRALTNSSCSRPRMRLQAASCLQTTSRSRLSPRI